MLRCGTILSWLYLVVQLLKILVLQNSEKGIVKSVLCKNHNRESYERAIRSMFITFPALCDHRSRHLLHGKHTKLNRKCPSEKLAHLPQFAHKQAK